jgi:hypothetical protein
VFDMFDTCLTGCLTGCSRYISGIVPSVKLSNTFYPLLQKKGHVCCIGWGECAVHTPPFINTLFLCLTCLTPTKIPSITDTYRELGVKHPVKQVSNMFDMARDCNSVVRGCYV